MALADGIKGIKMYYLKRIEKIIIQEIEKLSKIKLEELNELEKNKSEEKEHLEALKLSETERLQKIISEEKEKIYPNFRPMDDDDESLNNFKEKISNEMEIFIKNEMAHLKQLKIDEIKSLEKIKPEEIERYKNLLKKEIFNHKYLEEEEKRIFLVAFKKEIERKIKEFKIPVLSPPPVMSGIKNYNNKTNIKVIFKEINSENNNEMNPAIIIECSLNDKISELIHKYMDKIGNYSQNKKFLYYNKELEPDLTVENEKLYDGCLIQVINI